MNGWRRRDRRRGERGFTAIEIVVVVAIMGILAAIIFFAVQNVRSQAGTASTGTTNSEIDVAEQTYCLRNGQYATAPQLVAAGLLTSPDPNVTVYIYPPCAGGCGTYSLTALPVVRAVSPSSWPIANVKSVTITGAGFTCATAVAFGSTSLSTGFTVVSDSVISVSPPAENAGTVDDITVTRPGGTSAPGTKFTYS